jgi:hypothetical protein
MKPWLRTNAAVDTTGSRLARSFTSTTRSVALLAGACAWT